MKSKTVMVLAQRLAEQGRLTQEEYAHLIRLRTDESSMYLAGKADHIRREIYGRDVYIRGLIEISNICRNDCYYCGIRRSNTGCERYRLTKQQILGCCREGYDLGFRTFVMQGGEGSYSAGEIADIVGAVKETYPDCAVTLSLGEYTRGEYKIMRSAGADRYLLRHETADREHYRKLHPFGMSYENRMRCLYDLRELGYQVGCGFMVGSPYQTAESLAEDLKFIEEFSPDMCGIGPFIPQRDTPFWDMPAGSGEMTIFLLSVIRLIKPNILLPATTALGTVMHNGREQGIHAGANVIMPNLSPLSERKKYSLYDNKICTGEESAQSIRILKEHMRSIGYQIVTARGDIKKP
ncbi:[FeFe] hydrogenase H-cluster radical SAM maturase HydE [Ruminococcus sp. OA3]|nr:[FeFe] hydrogenase H-cluster radical SAM maturase HydE [Ruminococcus sp. OA3]MCH1983254.1 [FeFe] hydrogenase H-cluster radical SAM maturase HydE [Ruminococcus sp. OA3]